VTARADLAKLQQLSALVLDHRLAGMRAAAEAMARSRDQITALDRPLDAGDLPPVMADLVACGYQRWADQRRVELNAVLARQTAAYLAARAEAERAFGRSQALAGLARQGLDGKTLR
jgi:hypothetical protein